MSGKQTFRIEGTLPGLNEYTRANRSNYHSGAQMKKQTETMIGRFIRLAKLKPVQGRVHISYQWIEPNERRDLDNIAFARKFVQDALVKSGVLAGDGRKHIKGFDDDFSVVSKTTPGVVVTICPIEETL